MLPVPCIHKVMMHYNTYPVPTTLLSHFLNLFYFCTSLICLMCFSYYVLFLTFLYKYFELFLIKGCCIHKVASPCYTLV